MNLKEISDLMWDKAATTKAFKLEPSDIAAWQVAKDVGWIGYEVASPAEKLRADLADSLIYGTPAVAKAIPVAEALNAELSKTSGILSYFTSTKETNVIGGDTCHLCGESKMKRVNTTEDCQCGCDEEFTEVETTYVCGTVVTKLSSAEMVKPRVSVVLGTDCIDISNAVKEAS